MVRPDTRSDLKSWKLYSVPHWKIGKMYCIQSTNLLKQVWSFNCRRGSSGKNTSPSLCLSAWSVVFGGGRFTLWISKPPPYGRDDSRSTLEPFSVFSILLHSAPPMYLDIQGSWRRVVGVSEIERDGACCVIWCGIDFIEGKKTVRQLKSRPLSFLFFN